MAMFKGDEDAAVANVRIDDENPREGIVDPTRARPKNWPVCRPILRHDIHMDIPREAKFFMRRMYLAWYGHCLALLWNWICVTAALVGGDGTRDLPSFFYALISLVLGVPGSFFFVYWLLYSAVSNQSAFRLVLFLGTFILQIALSVLFFIGISGWGSAGLWLMFELFDVNAVVAIMVAVSVILWGAMIGFSVVHWFMARALYQRMGGMSAAKSSLASEGKQFAIDNKDTIRNAAIASKDVLRDVVVENKEAIAQAVIDNRDTIVQLAANQAQQPPPKPKTEADMFQ